MSYADRDPRLSTFSPAKFSPKLDAFRKLSAAERRDIVKLPGNFSRKCFPDGINVREAVVSNQARSDVAAPMGKGRSKWTSL